MPTVLITGANRGLGLEFARQYAADGWTVLATARDPQAAEALAATGAEIHAYDALDPQALEGLQADLGDRAIDVLIANAGVLGPQQFDRQKWSETFLANVIAPTELALRLKPNVLASDQRKMVALSSILGSITANESGGILAYRSSKAALNAAWRSLAIDWKDSGLTLAMIHPGWVQTDMGGQAAPVTVEDSVNGLRRALQSLTREDNGRLIHHDGRRAATW